MSWDYDQSSGSFVDPSGTLQALGYSGQPPHVNDPAAQSLENVGPIPAGLWQAVELIPESATHGPFVIRLEPYPQTETFGRSGFMMHGERLPPAPPGFASDGCIIMPREIRELFWQNSDHDINVIGGNND